MVIADHSDHPHPGEGRGPVVAQKLAEAAPGYIDLPDWAPACAGVVQFLPVVVQ